MSVTLIPGCCPGSGLNIAYCIQNFTAVPNTIHLVDTSGQGSVVTLPNQPGNGVICTFADHGYLFGDPTSGFGTNNLIIYAGENDLIQGGGVRRLTIGGDRISLVYYLGKWVAYSK